MEGLEGTSGGHLVQHPQLKQVCLEQIAQDHIQGSESL